MGSAHKTTRQTANRTTAVRSTASASVPGPAIVVKRILRILVICGFAAVLLSIVLVLPWRWFAPPTSAFMLRERLFGETSVVRHRWASWGRMSPHLSMTVIAAEDQKFAHHFGFDFESIADALDENAKRRRGASTISQQVAKNLYLWPGRSYLRKGVEAYLTLLIESLWPKRRILEIYLNVAEFGPGIYGAEAASRQFFKKPASRLSLWEASLLAAVLPNPKRMSASRPSAYVRGRAADIRMWVRKLGGKQYLESL